MNNLNEAAQSVLNERVTERDGATINKMFELYMKTIGSDKFQSAVLKQYKDNDEIGAVKDVFKKFDSKVTKVMRDDAEWLGYFLENDGDV